MRPDDRAPCYRCSHPFLSHYVTFGKPYQYGCSEREDHDQWEHSCCNCDGFVTAYVPDHVKQDD